MSTPPSDDPPKWAKDAFILCTAYLAAHIEQNNVETPAADCFYGASVTTGAKIVMKAFNGVDLKMFTESKTDGLEQAVVKKPSLDPLMLIVHLSKPENRCRVVHLAEHFNVPQEEIEQLIAAPDSGMVIKPGGWVKLLAATPQVEEVPV